VAGAVLTAAGSALTVIGAGVEVVEAAGLAALAALIGLVIRGPVVARPAAALLGSPQAAWRGMSGVLARRNSMRYPRRTAGSATPLMIGVAVVSLFAVLAASLKQSIGDAVEEQFAGELVISGEGSGGFSTDLAPAIAELPEVAAASPEGGGPARVDGENTLVSTFDPATIEAVENLEVREGSLRDVEPDQVAITVVQRVADRLGAPDVQTNQEFVDSIAAEIDVIRTVVYVLLLILTIVIALMGSPTHCRCRSMSALASSRCCGRSARPRTRPWRWSGPRPSRWRCSAPLAGWASACSSHGRWSRRLPATARVVRHPHQNGGRRLCARRLRRCCGRRPSRAPGGAHGHAPGDRHRVTRGDRVGRLAAPLTPPRPGRATPRAAPGRPPLPAVLLVSPPPPGCSGLGRPQQRGSTGAFGGGRVMSGR
jgi:hypothetical protein